MFSPLINISINTDCYFYGMVKKKVVSIPKIFVLYTAESTQLLCIRYPLLQILIINTKLEINIQCLSFVLPIAVMFRYRFPEKNLSLITATIPRKDQFQLSGLTHRGVAYCLQCKDI